MTINYKQYLLVCKLRERNEILENLIIQMKNKIIVQNSVI
jgi:hypothetical protein